jgi:hypothetical protein
MLKIIAVEPKKQSLAIESVITEAKNANLPSKYLNVIKCRIASKLFTPKD